MDDSSAKLQDVIACVDGSAIADAVCEAGGWASRQLQSRLLLLHVLDRSEYPAEGDLSGNIGLGTREHLLNELVELDNQRGRVALEQGKLMLAAGKQRALTAGTAQVESLQRHGYLVESLQALEAQALLFVAGRYGERHDPAAQAIGSNIENIVRAIQRPILITPQQFRVPRSFLIAYDASATAQKALAMVAGSPLLRGLPCHVVMVSPDAEDKAMTDQLELGCARLRDAGFEVTRAMLEGEPQASLELYQQTHDIGLIVMGAYGHSRIRQFFVGSHTTNMIRRTEIPLLLLR